MTTIEEDDNIAMYAQLAEIQGLPSTQEDDNPVLDNPVLDNTKRQQRDDLYEELYARRDLLDKYICKVTQEHKTVLEELAQLNQDEHAERQRRLKYEQHLRS
jgi:hypothetical protein